LFQTGDVVYGEGKLRDFGMVFKPSFKCLKNKKINFSPAFLKLETLLYQSIYYIYIISSYIIFAERFLFKKKSGLREKKTCHIIYILIHLILYSQSDFDSKKKVV